MGRWKGCKAVMYGPTEALQRYPQDTRSEGGAGEKGKQKDLGLQYLLPLSSSLVWKASLSFLRPHFIKEQCERSAFSMGRERILLLFNILRKKILFPFCVSGRETVQLHALVILANMNHSQSRWETLRQQLSAALTADSSGSVFTLENLPEEWCGSKAT